MSATLKTSLLLAKIILVVGLLGGIVFAPRGFAQTQSEDCVMTGGSAAATTSCQHCCAATQCCLTSKPAAPAHPEPSSNERSHQLDQAPLAVGLTLVSAFDFLALPRESRARTGGRVVPPAYGRAPRGAVSCIWLI